MGLDMMLYRRRYLRTDDFWNPEVRETITLTRGGETVPLTKPTYLIETVIEWRKANQIHLWFVTNVQDGLDDCKQHYVTIEQLTELRDLCNRVLQHNHLAETLLPPQSGFFFGSTLIDEWYFKDLAYTVEQLNILLNDPAVNQYDFYYHSSW